MFSELLALLQLSFALGAAYAFPSTPTYLSDTDTAPIVQLDNATVLGLTNNSVTSFTGIPFAHPPCAPDSRRSSGRFCTMLTASSFHNRLGDLRLRLPKPIESYNGTIDATHPAIACVQLNPRIRPDLPTELGQAMQAYAGGFAGGDVPQSEDCALYPLYCRKFERLTVIRRSYG